VDAPRPQPPADAGSDPASAALAAAAAARQVPAAADGIDDGAASASGDDAHTVARAGLFDLARLAGTLGLGKVRADFDAQAEGCRWARALLAREQATALRIGVLGRGVDLVGTREASNRILRSAPDAGAHPPGDLKRNGMAFLAPAALTVSDGAEWRRLRSFNEAVLGTGDAHPYAQTFLGHVRAAFEHPVSDRADIRRALGRAMVGIILGEPPADMDPAEDARVLLDYVQSPLKRKLLGWRQRARRERLYALIERRWRESSAGDRTLLGLARRAAVQPTDALLQQVPHWMFTFTASGTDLLTRALALILARPEARMRVLDEMDRAGPLNEAVTIARLDFTQACLLEAGRLFPPATRTFHRMPAGGGRSRDIVHYFPLLQRDDALGPTVHRFAPERWLSRELDAPAAASNLFLRGPRACPGSDLILFVCRSALARLIGELRQTADASVLTRDPLPLSFPERVAHFTTER
jgi:hypothetical protein